MTEEADRPTEAEIATTMEELEHNQKVLDYSTKEFTIELLVAKFEGPDPDIFVPEYQRRFNWEARRQSRFIESLLVGLPIPFLFFADMSDGRYEVVDGNQRLNTCAAFMGNRIELQGLERVSSLDGFTFRDLSATQQRRFKNRTIRSIVLSQRASERDRRDLFDRINTGSLIAEPIEVRRGSQKGAVTDLIDTLAHDGLFEQLCPMTKKARDKREGEELVSRFLAFGEGLRDEQLAGYRDRVGDYLSKWLKEANEKASDEPALVDEYREKFGRVMGFVQNHFANGFAKTATATTTPRVRFGAIAVGVALALDEDPDLLTRGPAEPVDAWLDSDDFFYLTTSSAANVRSKVIARSGYVKAKLLGLEKDGLRHAGHPVEVEDE